MVLTAYCNLCRGGGNKLSQLHIPLTVNGNSKYMNQVSYQYPSSLVVWCGTFVAVSKTQPARVVLQSADQDWKDQCHPSVHT